MKIRFCILVVFMIYILPCKSVDLSLKNFSPEIKINTEKSTLQNYTSTNISAGLSIKEFFYENNDTNIWFSPGWCGTFQLYVDSGYFYYLEKNNINFLNLGLNLKKYNSQENEYDYTFQLFNCEILIRSLFDDFFKNMYFEGKLLNINRGVYRDFEIDWIKVLFGYGFNIYKSKDGYFIPNITAGFDYSSIQFDRRSSGNISKFAGINLSSAELNAGIYLPFRYKNLELKLQNQVRHLMTDSAFMYIFENNLKIGYNFFTEENNKTSEFSKTKFQFPVAISADFHYDFIKIEENIQPQPSVSINLEFDPVFLFSIF